jgi:hypothetical protein
MGTRLIAHKPWATVDLMGFFSGGVGVLAVGQQLLQGATKCWPNNYCIGKLLDLNSWLFILLWIVMVLCLVGFCAAAFKGLLEGVRYKRMVPTGFFIGAVTSISDPHGTTQTEYNLAQIFRNSDGALEYRGIGKFKDSPKVDFCWWARDTTCHATETHTRFTFQTKPDDIFVRPPNMPQDVANLGMIDYYSDPHKSSGQGTFFDYRLRGDFVERKMLQLLCAHHLLSDAERKAFSEFFDRFGEVKKQEELAILLERVEQLFGQRTRLKGVS